ncbi:hypothetical protein [Sphingomonas sp. PAMC 26617]|uniref:hypothetical protein n=1 Tax=Sphingomonas sp. PAMC 26617 TaxID=1112216 RepID=UPI000289ED97|nr:hypothetical protein [Sphingomonas sp. PAMC 26617]
MIIPDPTGYAVAENMIADVTAKLAEWQALLDERRADAVQSFAIGLDALVPPEGVSFDEYAEVQVDRVVDRWCQQRDAFCREFVGMLNPVSIVVAQNLAVAAELGQLAGLHLDNALSALDRDLRTKAGWDRQ